MNSTNKKTRRTPEQVIADLQKKQKDAEDAAKKKRSQLQAQIKAQQAKLTTAARKEDTHCKVVMGALVMGRAAHNPEFSREMRNLIQDSSETPETKEKILSRL